MMDLQTIRDLNRSATNRAKRHGKRPWLPTLEQRERLKAGASLQAVGAHIPMLGDYVPRSYVAQESLFCDKSGWGGENEPAMTQGALAKAIGADPIDIAYAAGDEGQFQIYVHRYKVPRKLHIAA